MYIYGMSFWSGGFSFNKDVAQSCFPKLLVLHFYFLILVAAVVAFWLFLRPQLPELLTTEGRRASLWDLVLVLTVLGIVFWQGSRMGRVVEANADDSEN